MPRSGARGVRWTAAAIVAAACVTLPVTLGANYGRHVQGLTPDHIRTILQSAHVRPVTFRGVTETRCFAPIPIRAGELSAPALRVLKAREDAWFDHHPGFNPVRMAAALLKTVSGSQQGGSTITQQLVKNTAFVPEHENAWVRKLLDPGYALLYEKAATKEEILTAYVNNVHFPHGLTGVEAFARYHYGKRASKLDHFEAVQLALAINQPSRWDPGARSNVRRVALLKRTLRELARLRDRGVIGEAEYRAAVKPRPRAGASRDDLYEMSCGFFQQAAAAIDLQGVDDPRHRAFVTLDPGAQVEAIGAAYEFTPALRRASGSQLAAVALGPDGRLLAIVGSADIEKSAWNRAIHARRQIGSLGKVPVIAAACERGLGPRTMVLDAPLKERRTRNGDGESLGPIPLHRATAESRNQAFLQLERRLGPAAAAAAARRLGLSRAPEALGISLGEFEASPIEVAAMMATIANRGRRVTPYAVRLVVGPYGRVLRSAPSGRQGEQVIREECADMVVKLLREVVRSGTASEAGFDVPAYGKTGTTNDFVDAWFAGSADRTRVVVWVGNDEHGRPMRGVTGGGIPARIAARFLSNLAHVEKERGRAARVAVAGGGAEGAPKGRLAQARERWRTGRAASPPGA